MEASTLTKYDYDYLQKLIKTTNSIETLYKRMYELEINNKKNTESYNQLLEYLKIALEVENKEYANPYFSYSKCCELTSYLLDNILPDNFQNNVESIMSAEYDHRIIRRILNVLITKIITNRQFVNNMIPEESMDILNQLGIEPLIINKVEIYDKFEKEILNSYLLFLSEEYTQEDKTLKELLIQSKYNVSFMYKEIEDSLLQNNFESLDDLTIHSEEAIQLIQINNDLYEMLKEGYGERVMATGIDELLDIKDEDYKENTMQAKSIFCQSFIRSAFLLIRDEELQKLYNNIQIQLENSDTEDYQISKHYLENCFKNTKKDRNNIIIKTLQS